MSKCMDGIALGANTKSMGVDGSSQCTNVRTPCMDVCVVGADENKLAAENYKMGRGGIIMGADVKKVSARTEVGIDGKS